MILVTVGTNGVAFDRLLRELDDLRPGEEVIVQRGPSKLYPRGATCVDYLPFREFDSLLRAARVVVMHAGVGSTLAALAAGHRPILVPRLAARGEAVDDHQLAFARRLDRDAVAKCVTRVESLRDLVQRSTRVSATPGGSRARPLVEELARYLAERCGAPTAR